MGFSLTRILPYKDRIYDSVLIRENMGQWKPVFSHIFRSVSLTGDSSIGQEFRYVFKAYISPQKLLVLEYFIKSFTSFQKKYFWSEKTS